MTIPANIDKNRVIVFDTTLRDGEQCPGATMNPREKLEIAHQLARLGVDVIEAGFPISSVGDFESVRTIASEVQGPTICGLARAVEKDITRAGEALTPGSQSPHPCLHRHQQDPPGEKAPQEQGRRDQDGGGVDPARPHIYPRRGVFL